MSSFWRNFLISSGVNVPADLLWNFPAGPIPTGLNLLLHTEYAVAPTRYDFDEFGFMGPSNGRFVDAQEQAYIDKYNNNLRQMTAIEKQVWNDYMANGLPLLVNEVEKNVSDMLRPNSCVSTTLGTTPDPLVKTIK